MEHIFEPTVLSQPDVLYDPADFISTATGVKISRAAKLQGQHQIHLNGKTVVHAGVELRGDLARINVGKYCTMSEGVTLRPSPTSNSDSVDKETGEGETSAVTHVPLKIGDYVRIGARSEVEAASVGAMVQIGSDCKISPRCILRDCCCLDDGTVLAADTVVPPFSLFAGAPGVLVAELPECTPELFKELAMSEFERFKPSKKKAM